MRISFFVHYCLYQGVENLLFLQGFNGADLRNICTEAGMCAIRAERDYVIHEDFMKVKLVLLVLTLEGVEFAFSAHFMAVSAQFLL